MEVNKSIFKAYDIRGIYPADINEQTAKFIAQTFLKMMSEITGKAIQDLKLAVGRDIRESSESMAKVVIDTFLEYGVQVADLGLISINDIYFAVGNYNYDGGLIATASHNPPEYGGFKMVYKSLKYKRSVEFINGKSLYAKMQELQFPLPVEKAPGQLNKKEILDDHLKHILSFMDLDKIKPFKVVVDTGNGMNGILIPKLFQKLPCELIHLFPELDGNFPNRNPNPLAEGAADKLGQKVVEEKADFGFIYDVDGDRMFMVDEEGKFIRGDMVLALLAKQMLKRTPGAGIAYNLICSHAVPELIEKWGGKPIRSEVGYFNLTKHMREEDGIMSGEVSAHFAFKDSFYADSGFVALVLALQSISEDGRKLSEIIKDLSIYAKGDEINTKVDDIQAKLDLIKETYKDNIRDEIDGITVEFEDWWFNVRPSNTEPLLRLTVEAKAKENLQKHQEEVLSLIKK